MKLSLRKVALILAVVLCTALSYAQQTDSEPKYSFVVWLHNGDKVTLPLGEHPVVTYSDGNIVVSTTDDQIVYPHTSVRMFTIEELEQLPDDPAPDPEPEPDPTPDPEPEPEPDPTPDPEPEPDPTPEFYFVVWMHSDACICFPLAEHPVLTYSDGDIVVATSKEQLTYAHADVRKFTLADEDISQDGETNEIVVTERDIQWQRQGDVMLFSDCTPDNRVIIYNATGQLVAQYAIASDGTLQIPLQQFVEGMYIVETESITYKFIKK